MTRDYLGLSGTIVRFMVSSQKKTLEKSSAKNQFFYIYNERVCVYVCIYVYISMYIYLYIPRPRSPIPRSPKARPRRVKPDVYFIVCASVFIALVSGLPFPTMKV